MVFLFYIEVSELPPCQIGSQLCRIPGNQARKITQSKQKMNPSILFLNKIYLIYALK